MFKKLKRGSGEILGFITLVPALFLFLMMIITMVRLVGLRQKMEYAAYSACRAAVLAETYDEALNSSLQVAQMELTGYEDIYKPGSVQTDVEEIPIEGYPESLGKVGYDSRTGQTRDSWLKGNLIKCTLSLELNGLNPILNGEKKCEIYMFLEKDDY